MEWTKHLAAYLTEELQDSVKYADMARQAEGGSRQMLRDMAREELIHARHVRYLMRQHHIPGAPDENEAFERAKQALMSL